MLNKYYKRIISLLLVIVFSCTILSTVFAENTQSNIVLPILENNAQINAEIIKNFNKTVDLEVGCYVNLEYDSQGRINRIIGKSGNVQEVIEITHNGDGTYTQVRTVNIQNDVRSAEEYSEENNIQLLSVNDGNYDIQLTDSSVKKRIKEAQEVWNNMPEMRTLAHTEALVARADFCVVYPKSTFAGLFLEGGSLNNGTYFRRALQYTTPQMYGNDIIALQRALMAYGYLDATDVKSEEYGYFGPTTQAAVIDYQKEKGLEVDGSVGSNTIKKLFSAATETNESQVTFDGLNRINVFRTKHEIVCKTLASRVSIKDGDIVKEAYIHNAGLKGNGGRADVVRKGTPHYVWEVKPDSSYGRKTGVQQVTTYVERSNDEFNKVNHKEYCPLQYGFNITPFTLQWGKNNTNVYVYSDPVNELKPDGVVYYKEQKGTNPSFQPAYSPILVPKPNEDYFKVSWPEPEIVLGGLAAITTIAVTSYHIGKAIIAVALLLQTGGLSYFLLCF